MLKNYLLGLPLPKLICIQDCVEAKGAEILDYLIKTHRKQRPDCEVHFFAFEGNFKKIQLGHSSVIYHDFTSDVLNWNSNLDDSAKLETEISKLHHNCVLVLDSLAHLLFSSELSLTYQLFHNLIKNKPNITQVITVLHLDMLVEKEPVIKCFRKLATVYLELELKSKFSDFNRVGYTFSKSPRKIINQIEEYHFESGEFICEKVKKPDVGKIESVVDSSLPEDLSTFKIALSDKDKESRSTLVLPYLPKSSNASGGGAIHYTLDDVDDWDEEDPDDDLDI